MKHSPMLVHLAREIRNAGIHGTLSWNTLQEFDRLARGKKFGVREYNGEALKLIPPVSGPEYYRIYPALSAMCDEIVRQNVALAA